MHVDPHFAILAKLARHGQAVPKGDRKAPQNRLVRASRNAGSWRRYGGVVRSRRKAQIRADWGIVGLAAI